MIKKPITLVPGPVSVSQKVLEAMGKNYGSGDLDPEFLNTYNRTESKLKEILGTKSSVIMQTGEGMWGLWGALKSTIKPGDKIVAICTGVFGYGIADMAESLGASVERVELDFDQTLNLPDLLVQAVEKHRPLMITAVHCETPSGTLNPLDIIAAVKREFQVPLLCVDTVASSGGTQINAEENLIDLSLNGSQKALSAPPSMSFVSVSHKAWEVIESVKYQGYDAFLPFKDAQKNSFFPSTPYWHGVAAIETAADLILEEGLENVFKRHDECMVYCKQRIAEMGLELYANPQAITSPTVTAVKLPATIKWGDFNQACLQKGLAIAGSYGKLSGKVFRIGHMGNQARMDLLKEGLDIIETVI